MRRLRPLLVVLAVLALIASCGTEPSTDTGESAATDPHDGAEHDDHDGHDEVEGDDQAPATDDDLSVTEATLAQLRDLDPEVLANAHRHDDHDGEHAVRDLPNGIDPHRIVIPSIGVDADVIELGLQPDGTMEVPTDYAQAGWFAPGPRPGRVGPAVIAGHVDDQSGPAVFFDLVELEAGDLIEVHSDDGETVTFAVRETQEHPKDEFPTEVVYGNTSGPELRLITCSGDFDRAARSYRDNTIVFAERVDA